MSFSSILIISVIFLAFLVPVTAIFSFYKGYALGIKDWNTHNPEEIKAEPTKKRAHMATATDKELQNVKILLENIENYDGTGANQKEINNAL